MAPSIGALGGALLVMCLASAGNTAVAVYLGKLVDSVDPEDAGALPARDHAAPPPYLLGMIGLAYLVRESMNVLRRFLVERTCTRINKDMCVRLVGHLMKVDLSILAQDQVGALYGRITRSVGGLRPVPADQLPRLRPGAPDRGVRPDRGPLEAAPGRAGHGRRRPRLALALTIWQLITQKGIRLDLMRTREVMDGTVVELLSGIDYVRAANTHRQEIRRVARTAERQRSKEIRHHFEMSLFGCGKALNEGFFHILVLALAIYLFVHGRIRLGDILTFSVLYLNVMCPLNEVHRFIDEAHESSLRVGDLFDLLSEPVDRSFKPAEPREPTLGHGRARVRRRAT